MRILIVLMLSMIAAESFGQKRIIDEAACRSWQRLETNGKTCLLSANGNYVMFKTFSEDKRVTTILKNLKSLREKRFVLTGNEKTFDNDRIISFQYRDSLILFDTQKETYTYLAGVKQYFVIGSNRADKIGYFSEQSGKNLLTIWDAREGQILQIPNADMEQYWFNEQGTALLTKSTNGVTFTDIRTLKQASVSKNANVENAAFSQSGNEIAYISKTTNGYELDYFDLNTGTGAALLNDSSDFLKNNWKLEAVGLSFNNDDGNVFFKVSPVASYDSPQKQSVITKDLDVWSYRDLYLQEKQLSNLRQEFAFTSMINIKSRKVIQLETEGQTLQVFENTNRNFILTTIVNDNEFYWNRQKMSMFLFSAITGEKELVKESAYPGLQIVGISPDNKFLVWFDGTDRNYYAFNISTGTTSNISRSVYGSLSVLNQRGMGAKSINKPYPYNAQYWINNGEALIVHSSNDVWQLDPAGIKSPINLTNGYGDLHNIRLILLEDNGSPVWLNKNELWAWAFNYRSKQNGFWKIKVGKSSAPVKLVMSDDAYYFLPQAPLAPGNSAEDPSKFKPIKATGKNVFIVRKMNAAQTPNLYYTTDFKKFKQISSIQPNKDYLGVRTKLISYTLPDGQQAEGILHIPENLDSTKKYPIIFNYYERRSEGLNVYRTPQLSGHNINIPWYVSRGYLVFEPDFYYERGKTAQSIINCVEAAITQLEKLPYVDIRKMGIQGQSHGGYETNVLATGTNIFTAACEMAGYTNLITEYGSIRPGGFNNQVAADLDQRNLGVFPWEHPDVFIQSSPVFHVGKMTTPLLMVHNKGDGGVLFPQAVELFLAGRRLGKKVWMLQYDGEGHTNERDENKLDLTLRMQQFFDHYLKGAPAPVWMTQGIKAKDKGSKSGFELDYSGNCNEHCKICKDWNERYRTDSAALKEEIKQREISKSTPW